MNRKLVSSRLANQRFFDLVADVYERVDGRRSEETPEWLGNVLADLKERAPVGPFIEVGCGSGWLLDIAGTYFAIRHGCDVSSRILRYALARSEGVVCAAAQELPFSNTSAGVVAFFATLHHLPTWQPALAEAHRVLKPGGWLYCDHDIDSAFLNRFGPVVHLYRRLRKAENRYREACPELTPDLYHQVEIHEEAGVSAKEIARILAGCGFVNIHCQWHWMGVSPVIDTFGRLLGSALREGLAPLLRVVAQKRQ